MLKSGRQKFTFNGHPYSVFSVAFSPQCIKNELENNSNTCEFRLVSASWDRTARVWRIAPDRELLTLTIPESNWTVISPDGTLLALGFDDGSVKTYNISTTLAEAFEGKYPDSTSVAQGQIFCCHSGKINYLAFSPDGAILATSSEDRTVKLWNVADGKERQTLSEFPSDVGMILYSPDGSRLAAVYGLSIQIWDLTTSPVRNLVTVDARQGIEDLVFSPNGKQLAVGQSNNYVAVFDSTSGENLFSVQPESTLVKSVDYSSDGTWLVAAGEGDSITFWDAKTGALSHSLKTRSGSIGSIVFSPNGLEIAGTGYDQTTKIWNVALGQEIATLTGHTDVIFSASYHPNCSDLSDQNCGRWLVTESYDGTFQFYLTQIEDLVALARARVTRQLSSSECVEFLHRTLGECGADMPELAPKISTSLPNMEVLPPSNTEKVCEITSYSGVNDQFFNQLAYSGVKKAAELFQWETALIESSLSQRIMA